MRILLALAALFGIERPGLRRMVGIGLGFIGAALIVGPRGSLPSPDLYGWMALLVLDPGLTAAFAVGYHLGLDSPGTRARKKVVSIVRDARKKLPRRKPRE